MRISDWSSDVCSSDLDEGTRVSNRARTGECCAVAALNLSSRVVGEGRGGERQCRPGQDRALVDERAGARVDGKRTTGLQEGVVSNRARSQAGAICQEIGRATV